MEILRKLSPAETYLICNGSKAQYKELLKLTLANLLLKQILKLEKRISNVRLGDGEIEISYILRGPKWSSSGIKRYEEVFTKPFELTNDLEVLFHQLVQIGFENSRGRYWFILKILRDNDDIKNYFNTGISRLFAPTSLTKTGLGMRKDVQNKIEVISRKLKDPNNINVQQYLREVLNQIGGNIYLIDHLNSELLKEIDDQLKPDKLSKGYTYDSGCFGYFHSYYDSSTSFDTAFDSASDSGGAGCGGDSGCSGCGGCGS